MFTLVDITQQFTRFIAHFVYMTTIFTVVTVNSLIAFIFCYQFNFFSLSFFFCETTKQYFMFYIAPSILQDGVKEVLLFLITFSIQPSFVWLLFCYSDIYFPIRSFMLIN